MKHPNLSKLIQIVMLSLLLTIFANKILPNEFYTQDMLIHLPSIKNIANPSLYQKDYLLQYDNPQKSQTIYYYLMAKIITLSVNNPKEIFAILHIGYLFLFFLVIISFFYLNFRSVFPGLILCLITLLRVPIGGTAAHLLEAEFIPRSLALVVGFWGALLFIRKRYSLALALYIFSFLYHPTSMLFSIIYTAALSFINTKSKLIKFTLVITLILLSACALALLKPQTMDFEWLNIIRERSPYAFMDMWSLQKWGFLMVLLLPGFIVSQIKVIHKQKIIMVLIISLIIGIAFTLLHFLFVIFNPTPFIIALQLDRAWYFPVLITLTVFAYSCGLIIRKKLQRSLLILAIGLLVIWRNSLSDRTDNQQWLEAQKWANNNTNIQCVFLVPFFTSGFRMESNRSIVGEYKDGVLSFYSNAFALEWMERLKSLSNWENLDKSTLALLQTKYKFNYIITQKSNLPYETVYNNNTYHIYKDPNSACN